MYVECRGGGSGNSGGGSGDEMATTERPTIDLSLRHRPWALQLVVNLLSCAFDMVHRQNMTVINSTIDPLLSFPTVRLLVGDYLGSTKVRRKC